MGGLKVGELVELGEEQASTVSDPLSDSFVELHDPEVEFWLVLGEHLRDEFAILSKFVDPEGEYESVSSLSSSPCGDPIRGRFNRASKGRWGEGELEFSNFLHAFFRRIGGVVICEYSVEVDEVPPEDVLKLCKRELRPTGAKVKSPDNLLEVLRPVIE